MEKLVRANNAADGISADVLAAERFLQENFRSFRWVKAYPEMPGEKREAPTKISFYLDWNKAQSGRLCLLDPDALPSHYSRPLIECKLQIRIKAHAFLADFLKEVTDQYVS